MMRLRFLTFSLCTLVGLFAGSAQAVFLAGFDFEIAGNHDGDPNTPNIFVTEPDFLSVPVTGDKVYNVTHNGVTLNFDASGTDGGNANRFRGGAITAFPLLTDFIQVRNNNDIDFPPYPEANLSFSGLTPSTEYAFTFYNHNQGAFQDEHHYYQGDVATGAFLGSFKSNFNTNDPENTEAGVTFNLFSDGAGEVDVAITRIDGQRITFNGMMIETLGGPMFTLGDTNNDGTVDTLDIDPFVLLLTDPAGYAAAFPGVDANAVGDINMDTVVDTLDIDPFVALLTAGSLTGGAVPEPGSIVLLGLAGVAGLALVRRNR